MLSIKKKLLKVKESEEKKLHFFNKKSLNGFTRLLKLGDDNQIKRANEIYEQHKEQNKEIKGLSIRKLNDEARAQNRRKRTIRKVQAIADKNSKRNKEERNTKEGFNELPEMKEEEEEE